MSEQEEIKKTGFVSSIRFRSSEGWTVFGMLEQSADAPVQDVNEFPAVQKEIPCTGTLPSVVEIGDKVEIIGTWDNNGKYGAQLKCTGVIPEQPKVDTDAGVVKVLCRLPGIGPVTANKIVKKHGHKKAWELAKEDPMSIGIQPHRVIRAREIILSLSHDYEAISFMLGVGLTDRQAALIIKHHGKDAVRVVTEEPYSLIDTIEGFGFLTVDLIALKAGINPGSSARVMAAIHYILTSSEAEGNTWLDGKRLCAIACEFLESTAQKARIPLINCPGYAEVRESVYALQNEGKVKILNGRVFSMEYVDAENDIFDAVNGSV